MFNILESTSSPRIDAVAASVGPAKSSSSDSEMPLYYAAAGIAGVALLVGALGCYLKKARTAASAAADAREASAAAAVAAAARAPPVIAV